MSSKITAIEALSHGRLPRTGISHAALLNVQASSWFTPAASYGATGNGSALW